MRQVLVDHARRRGAGKREGGRARVPLDEALAGFEEQGLDVIALHEALERLAAAHPRPAQVVDLRFFGGLSVPEVAELWASRTRRWRATGGSRGPGCAGSSGGAEP